jgi:hypothetical protein
MPETHGGRYISDELWERLLLSRLDQIMAWWREQQKTFMKGRKNTAALSGIFCVCCLDCGRELAYTKIDLPRPAPLAIIA